MNPKKLLELALKAQKNAHAPYSKYKIASALVLKTGEYYSGCNIENASYGATVCAERVAIWKAKSEHLKIEISEILVLTDDPKPWPPCGLCRQVLAEFATSETLIHLAEPSGIVETMKFSEIFPKAFGPHFLDK